MKVRTFDLVRKGDVDCELHHISDGGLMMLRTNDGRKIVRHISKCSFSKQDLTGWLEKVQKIK